MAEQTKEKENDTSFSYFDGSEFSIFENEDRDNNSSKNELVAENKITFVTYEEKLKELSEKKKKRNEKLKKIGKYAGILASPAVVLGLIIYGVVNWQNRISIVTGAQDKDELIRTADTYYVYGLSENTGRCWIDTAGIYCDPNDPYLYGTLSFDHSEVDHPTNIGLSVYVYESQEDYEPTERDLYQAEIIPIEGFDHEYDFEIHIPQKELANINYTCIEINELDFDDGTKSYTVYSTLTRVEQRIPFTAFMSNKITYYEEPFSKNKYDYFLNMVEFGTEDTFVDFTCDVEENESANLTKKRKKHADSVAQNAYLIVDGEEKQPFLIYDIGEDGQIEYMLRFGSVDMNAMNVNLVIGNTTFKLR